MDDGQKLTARVVPRVADVTEAAWDACANPEPSIYNPFVSYAFLATLETSRSVGPGTGWQPHHLLLEDAGGVLLGAMPLYLKAHSQGEYVFDHGWAEAYSRAGGRYYPKLQAAVPFTPVPGPRLLIRPGPDSAACEALLAEAACEIAARRDVSSLHVTFLPEAQAATLEKHGHLTRLGQQYHWHNRGYRSFAEFLGALASRKRKSLRKEREEVRRHGLAFEHVTGGDIREEHWEAMYAFYMDTGSRKWGRPYLTREFFFELGQRMADRCLIVLARSGEDIVAGALNVIGGDCLYGRYWGASEAVPFLHFEVCYYQAIDYAIANGLARVEAGAQGDHKLVRGYEPVPTYSSHYIRDPNFRAAVARFLETERREMAYVMSELSELGPYRRGPSPESER